MIFLQKKRYQDAANAAFTYLSQHPDHEMTLKNLRYYLNLPDVAVEKVVNLEAAPFVQKYVRGVQAYEDENYETAVIEFENSLESYMESEEQCRIYCEGPFDQGWYPEFTSSITSKTRINLIRTSNNKINKFGYKKFIVYDSQSLFGQM